MATNVVGEAKRELDEALTSERSDSELDRAFSQGLQALHESEVQRCYGEPSQQDEDMGITAIMAAIVGAPAIVKNLAKALGYVIKQARKLAGKEEGEVAFANKLVAASAKWKEGYVRAIRKVMESAGLFNRIDAETRDDQMWAAEVVFYTAVFGFAVDGGFATADAVIASVQQSEAANISTATVKSVLTAIRSKEVTQFIRGMV